ncbi:unnamed protein product [Mytilus edulis]|uniref:Uncharacterized protein n=1 Tax=Mytilus edulis TaxID=6550 RepID=A0A8S3UIH4_MYTED|nr:unnamed protein product [Mytilus edulis]
MSTLHQVEQYARSLPQIYSHQRTSPCAVVLSIGGNNIDSRHFNESEYMRLLKRILDTFNEAGVERVVICNILPRKTPIKISSEFYSQRRDLFNNRVRLLQDEQDVNPDIYEDLENVLIQIDMLADQGSTEVCHKYSLETNTNETTNTCIATVPTVPDTTHEHTELDEDKQFDEDKQI